MASPFYQLRLTGQKDITDFCSSFTFEDCTEDDDQLKIILQIPDSSLLDDPNFQVDKSIFFKFGYIGGKQSEWKSLPISDIDPRYGKTINVTVLALGSGIDMKKSDSNEVFNQKMTWEIALQIAKKYKLKDKISREAKRMYVSKAQGNKTDWDFLKEICDDEENGSFIFYIKDGALVLKKRDLSQESIRTYTYNDGNGPVTFFKPSSKKSKKRGSESQVTSTSFDPLKLEQIVDIIIPSNAQEEVSIGNSKEFDGQGNFTRNIITADQSRQAQKNRAQNALKQTLLNKHEAVLGTEGDPTIISDSIITMAGVAKAHSGNWYIKKVIHVINKAGYNNENHLVQNTSNAKQSNTSKGEKTQDAGKKEAKVFQFNANGQAVK